MKKQDQLLAEESLKEGNANIGDSSLSTIPKEQAVAVPGQFRGMDIEGLEGIPASMVAVPYCRVIQPTSKKTVLKDGTEATVGSFMFNDIQEEVSELNFVLLRAKAELVRVDANGNYVNQDYEGETKQKQIVKLLGITTDTNKLFILTITVTSFSTWGRLMAQFKAIKLDKTYRFVVKATTEKRENKKGKYYIVNFQLGEELGKDKVVELSRTAFEYGVVLDRKEAVEEE
jgi:hypothetical protein